jgi:hypothetical protein
MWNIEGEEIIFIIQYSIILRFEILGEDGYQVSGFGCRGYGFIEFIESFGFVVFIGS